MPSTRSSLPQTQSRASNVRILSIEKKKRSMKRLSLPSTISMQNVTDQNNNNGDENSSIDLLDGSADAADAVATGDSSTQPNNSSVQLIVSMDTMENTDENSSIVLLDASAAAVATATEAGSSTQPNSSIDTMENGLERSHNDDSTIAASTEQSSLKFVGDQQTPCYFHKSVLLYTSEEHHLYTKNSYKASVDTCYWVCQDKGCKVRIRTKGDPKKLKLDEPTVCWFQNPYVGHNGHATKEIKSKKQSKMEAVKSEVDVVEPSTSSKTSVAREVFNKLISPEE